MDMNNIYFQIWQIKEHINWDAALTLGTSVAVICRLAAYPINWLFYNYLKVQKAQNFYLKMCASILLTLIFCIGVMAAIILLGLVSGWTLRQLGFPQGVIWPYTAQGLVPYHG